MPFERAAQMFTWLTGATVTEPTARRRALGAGAAYVAQQEAEAAQIEREMPPAPPGPAALLLAVDGAMVPLVGGEWTEAKTLVLGEIGAPQRQNGEWTVASRALSYFSRCSPAERFEQQALGEVHRRGVEQAGLVAAVTDGAEWEQGFIDLHREDAVRILDFPHAAQRLPLIAQAAAAAGSPLGETWVAEQTRWLKQEGPGRLLAALAGLCRRHPRVAALAEQRAYLEKREAHMQYPEYQMLGLPLGSGAVESGNKLVVEARLKGAGMHWARAHLDPMLGLRNIVCSDRWEEAWPQIAGRLQRAPTSLARRATLSGAVAAGPPATSPAAASGVAPPGEPPREREGRAAAARGEAPPRRPAADHPWRRYPVRGPRGQSPLAGVDAKH
jgi:hypothetical protein